MKNLRVAIIEPVGGHGGLDLYDFSLASSLADQSLDVSLYTSAETAEKDHLTFRLVRSFRGIWGKKHRFIRGVNFIVSLCNTMAQVMRQRANVVHFHFFHYTIMEKISVNLAALLRIKIVITAHDIESFSGKHTFRSAAAVLRKADRVIVHNYTSKSELVGGSYLADDLVDVIHMGNFLPDESILPTQILAKQHLGLDTDDTILLFFGQIKQVKGLDLLLEAMASTVKVVPRLKLLVAGKLWKDNLRYYQNIIDKYEMTDAVILNIEFIPDKEIAYYFRAADLVVLPYRRIYQSAVLLQAMSYGTPVLCSDIPGMTETICDGANGFLFHSEDVSHLSRKIQTVCSNLKNAREIGLAGKRWVSSERTWAEVGRKTAAVYEAVQ